MRRQLSELQFKRKAETDLYFWNCYVMGFEDMWEPVHGEMCQRLQDTSKPQKLFLYPRGHFKSSVITKGFSTWLLTNNSNRRIGIFNFTEDLVVSFLRHMRLFFEQSPIFNQFWGHLVPPKNDRVIWREDAIQLNRELVDSTPSVEARSIQADTTGSHHDVHIYDDLVCKESVMTGEAVAKLESQFIDTGAIINPPSIKDPYRGFRVAPGTRWHFNDLYNKMLTPEADGGWGEDWDCVVRKAVEGGKPILPDKFTLELLARKRREMGSWHYSAQYMNEPVDEENAPFPPSCLKRWNDDRERWVEEHLCFIFMSIDPAWSTDHSTDAWGVNVGAVTVDNAKFMLESRQIFKRLNATLDEIVGMARRWRPIQIGYEATGGQIHLMKQLQKKLDKAELPISITPMSHHNINKEVRILDLQAPFERGDYYLHEPGCDDVYRQLLHFPRGKNDDCVDSLEMFNRIARPPNIRSPYHGRVMRGTGGYEIKELKKKKRGMGKRSACFADQKGKRHGR